MLRRFTSILVIVITLMSFFVSTSFARSGHSHGKKSVKREQVVKKKAHKVRKEKKLSRRKSRVTKRRHKTENNEPRMKKKVKVEREDSRIKVN